ncbi:MAG: radical SAM protein [Patescibacteria group bacterium]
MLNYPPVSSAWHLPMGVSWLTSHLRQQGHEVIQRYGHISGLEYVLQQHGGDEITKALKDIRNSQSDILSLYEARMTLEKVSRSIPSEDSFAIIRNNVNYVSKYRDGTIDGLLRAINNREQHIWYDYFNQIEIPIAIDFNPNIYGISIADERQLLSGCILASMVKDYLPETIVVLGGNFWSQVSPAFSHPDFIKFSSFCDAVVYREGFRPIEELANTLKPSQSSGVAWFNNNRVIVNPPTKQPIDFQLLPTPEFDVGVNQWSPEPVYPLYTASNCPMACDFCAIGAGSDTYLCKPRMMTPRRIAEHMVETGVMRFDISDETLLLNRQLALGRELKNIGYPATWQCLLNVDGKLRNPDICFQLYEAGCRSVQLGFESLSSQTLKQEHKSQNKPEDYGLILKNLKDAGIQTHAFLLIGTPGEPLHWGIKWLDFLDKYGDYILTIKSGRYRLVKMSPDGQGKTRSKPIEVLPDTKPLHPNLDFRYVGLSRKRVEAMRDILEMACREHWGYAVTSTIPWWINRGRYTWDEMRQMAGKLPKEYDIAHFDRTLTKIKGVVRDELSMEVNFNSYNDVLNFAKQI